MDNFTFDYYREIFEKALAEGYKIITLKEFFIDEYDKNEKVLINKIDVDVRIDRLNIIYEIFKALKIRGSIYVRLHAPSYNLLTIGNIRTIQRLISIGCEIGVHTELEDVGNYCDINHNKLLMSEIKLFEVLFNTKIYGSASHGDFTPYNNLDFWKHHKASEFGLIYEAYDEKLWNHCRYVSDSEWTRWKAYDNGKLLVDDRRTPIEHIEEGVKVINLLTHPENWYKEYYYE